MVKGGQAQDPQGLAAASLAGWGPLLHSPAYPPLGTGMRLTLSGPKAKMKIWLIQAG